MRKISGNLGVVVSLLAISLALFHLYTTLFGICEPRVQRAVHLAFIFALSFLLFPATEKSPKDKATFLDVVLSIISVIPPLFLIFNSQRINLRIEQVSTVYYIEVVLGTLNIILLIEAVRRAVARSMSILILISLSYIFLLGPYIFKGVLYFQEKPFYRLIEIFYLFIDEGIYGNLTGISATFVAIFVILGAFVSATGVGNFFNDFACKVAGKTRGGPAKIAVISSGLFGMISGVAVANVYATGTFTIPLMKRIGYKNTFAGAVEAAASTGGMLMPPIMGAGAFVMAEITGIPYWTICKSAVLAAILYYWGVGLMVHFEAVKNNLGRVSDKDVVSIKYLLKKSYLILPIIGLVAFLVLGFSPLMAAFIAITISILTFIVNKDVKTIFKTVLNALETAGKNMVMVGLAIAGAGIVVAVITHTGLGLLFSSLVISWSKGIIFFALFFIMIASLILGAGLPCTAAYVIAISVGGLPLSKLGIDQLSSNLFVFYFAILAAVTPPVALAAYAAASISGSDPMKTGFMGLKIALAGFIVPYIFVFNNSLLLFKGTSLLDTFLTFISSFFGITVMAYSLIGWKIKESYKDILLRFLMFVAAILIFIIASSSYFLFKWLIILGFCAIFSVKIILKNLKGPSKTSVIK